METDWTRHWEENYGNLSWKIWAWRTNQAYRRILKNASLGKNPKILELGAGTGINSMLISEIAKAGEITLVDFNQKAFGISRKIIKTMGHRTLKGAVCKAPCFWDAQEHNSILKDGVLSSVLDIIKDSGFKLSARYISKNILDLILDEKFDIVHSEGLIEHFYGKDRNAVFKKHIDFCKKNGLIIIFVPRKGIAYSLNKLLHKILGKWIWDEEPFSKQELHKLCRQFNLQILKECNSLLFQEVGILARKNN